MYRFTSIVTIFLLFFVASEARSQYLTCERDADCWSLQKENRWCDEMVKCHGGRCNVVYRGPCNPDLETCDLQRRRCDAKYCTHDDYCPGGYCDEFRMRCAAGVRPKRQTIHSSPSPKANEDLPGDQPVSFTGRGAWTYYITLAAAVLFAIVATTMAYICCIQ